MRAFDAISDLPEFSAFPFVRPVVADRGAPPGEALAAEILASLEGRLARMKWPKSIDFARELPRDPSGKLLKRRLRDPYWAGETTQI